MTLSDYDPDHHGGGGVGVRWGGPHPINGTGFIEYNKSSSLWRCLVVMYCDVLYYYTG